MLQASGGTSEECRAQPQAFKQRMSTIGCTGLSTSREKYTVSFLNYQPAGMTIRSITYALPIIEHTAQYFRDDGAGFAGFRG